MDEIQRRLAEHYARQDYDRTGQHERPEVYRHLVAGNVNTALSEARMAADLSGERTDARPTVAYPPGVVATAYNLTKEASAGTVFASSHGPFGGYTPSTIYAWAKFPSPLGTATALFGSLGAMICNGSQSVRVYLVTVDWDPSTLTWTNQPVIGVDTVEHVVNGAASPAILNNNNAYVDQSFLNAGLTLGAENGFCALVDQTSIANRLIYGVVVIGTSLTDPTATIASLTEVTAI